MALLSPAGRRIALVSRDEELDSLLACRRIAAHLDELTPVHGLSEPPDVALVCDDEAVTEELLERDVPVVQLSSAHRITPPPCPAGRALRRLHRPGWLPGPWPEHHGVRATGALAPARLSRKRQRSGTLMLLSLWDVAEHEAEAFAAGPLRALVRAAVHRTGHCEVVCDTRLPAARAALDGIGSVWATRAADVDVDALHADAEVFLAAPVLGALALAQARRAPLVFLPPLGPVQRDLCERVTRTVPVPVVTDPGDPSVWAPPAGDGPWRTLDPALDDLRGAQRVARSLRQLSLAPL
ncbi:CGA synthase-related protein [Streptomyces morookaense]|uniref:CGA synthase-related protein n=1 Tax=Streptomyces morookaense TaxID=1970 RepID=UPI0033CFC41E